MCFSTVLGRVKDKRLISFFTLSGIPFGGAPWTGPRALTLTLTLCTDNGGVGGERRVAACESGAAAGQDQTPASTQVAMAVSGAANPGR